MFDFSNNVKYIYTNVNLLTAYCGLMFVYMSYICEYYMKRQKKPVKLLTAIITSDGCLIIDVQNKMWRYVVINKLDDIVNCNYRSDYNDRCKNFFNIVQSFDYFFCTSQFVGYIYIYI